MNIVQIGPYPISPDCICGGVETSVFGLTQELVRQGHNVYVLDMPRLKGVDRLEEYDNLQIHRYANCGTHNEDAIRSVEIIADDVVATSPQVVHIHGTGLISAKLYDELCKRGYKPLVTIHGLVKVEKRNALKKAWYGVKEKMTSREAWETLLKATYQYCKQSKVECNMLEHIPHAIVDTAYLVDALKMYRLSGLPQLHVIPQGAKEDFYDIKNTASGNPPRILCVGAFSQRKSQIELIQAFDILREKGISVQLVLCGVVSERQYYDRVCDATKHSPYKNDIELKINMPHKELIKEYQRATIFALHSQEESQGIVFVEAMAAGLPVVATNVGGIPYVVEDGKCGFLAPYGDVKAMANNMEKLLEDENLRVKMSKKVRQVAEIYRWENITKEILDLYTCLA